MFISALLCSEIYSESCIGTQMMNVFPNNLSLESIPEGYSAPWMASEARKVLMVRNWTSIWNAIRFIPGGSLPHLIGRTRRDEYRACITKGQTESDHRRKASL